MTPLPLGRVRVLRKKRLLMLIEAGQDPNSTTCSQCGLDVEPEEVDDDVRHIRWVVRYCLHCGHRAVVRIDLVVPQPREATDWAGL